MLLRRELEPGGEVPRVTKVADLTEVAATIAVVVTTTHQARSSTGFFNGIGANCCRSSQAD
jgi:hypothetical protein